MTHASTAPAASPSYALGHSDRELDRLVAQGRFIDDLMEHVLRSAGLGPGMRVLDAGCGAGDVSLLAARLVGPTGRVLGVDRAEEAVALANRRSAHLPHVAFRRHDLAELTLDEPVDALVGRLVLMYFSDPAVVLRCLARSVKPGGLVAFQEIRPDTARSEPRCDLFETTVGRITRTFERAGISLTTGLRLAQIFEEAGLPTPSMLQLGRVEAGPDSPAYGYVAEMARTLLPLMERVGVASARDVQVDTLAERLREEALARRATLVLPSMFGAWVRKPAEGELS